jgi:hypothetical protein
VSETRHLPAKSMPNDQQNPEIYVKKSTCNLSVWQTVSTSEKQAVKLQLSTCYNMADITYRTQFYKNTTHAP